MYEPDDDIIETARAAVADLCMAAMLKCDHQRGDAGVADCEVCRTLARCLEWECIYRTEWAPLFRLLLSGADDVLKAARHGGVVLPLPTEEDVLAALDD